MTDYHHQIERMWGAVQTEWKPVKLEDKYLSVMWTVLAWTGMIAFFVFALTAWATKWQVINYWMIGSLVLWLIAGIMMIRLRRAERKLITLDK
jgi:hypothetical protein